MFQTLTVKFTDGEVALLDWLKEHRHSDGRSETIRAGIAALALQHKAPEKLVRRAHRERRQVGLSASAAAVKANHTRRAQLRAVTRGK